MKTNKRPYFITGLTRHKRHEPHRHPENGNVIAFLRSDTPAPGFLSFLGTDTPASGKKNPTAEHVVTNVFKSQLKIYMPIVLSGGLKHARAVLNPEIIMNAYVKTGAAQAWGPSLQQRAVALQSTGKLFSGDRQEDSPYGHKADPFDLEIDEAAIPDGAPSKPKQGAKSARALFVHKSRDVRKQSLCLKTLKQAEDLLKKEWGE